jgi:hypothetical protein
MKYADTHQFEEVLYIPLNSDVFRLADFVFLHKVNSYTQLKVLSVYAFNFQSYGINFDGT